MQQLRSSMEGLNILMDSSNSNGDHTTNGSEENDSNKDSWVTYLRNKIMGKNCPNASVEAHAFEYKMDHLKRGKAIIFNQKNFEPVLNVGIRNGTDEDKKCLEITFKCLGFQVCSYDDLTYKQVVSKLKEVASEDHSNSDCIVITVLSHGTPTGVYAKDELYNTDVLTQYFTPDNCKTLAGKPKMFCVLACRGDAYDDGTTLQFKRRRYATDGDDDESTSEIIKYKIPNQADFLTVYSTSPGFYSWRNSKTGSRFIQCLCRVLVKYHETVDVLTMMTYVNREVAINFESNVPKDVLQHAKKQMPNVSHTLIRQFYLPKKAVQRTLV